MKKGLVGKIRTILLNGKIFVSRSTSYISVINSGMILFLTLERLASRGVIKISNLESYFFLFLGVGIIMLIIIGYFERKLKGHSEESTICFNQNPPMKDMKMKLDYLYEKLKEEEKQK